MQYKLSQTFKSHTGSSADVETGEAAGADEECLEEKTCWPDAVWPIEDVWPEQCRR